MIELWPHFRSSHHALTWNWFCSADGVALELKIFDKEGNINIYFDWFPVVAVVIII